MGPQSLLAPVQIEKSIWIVNIYFEILPKEKKRRNSWADFILQLIITLNAFNDLRSIFPSNSHENYTPFKCQSVWVTISMSCLTELVLIPTIMTSSSIKKWLLIYERTFSLTLFNQNKMRIPILSHPNSTWSAKFTVKLSFYIIITWIIWWYLQQSLFEA